MNELQIFENAEYGNIHAMQGTSMAGQALIPKVLTIDGIDCYEKDGVVYLKLETVARGLGFTHVEKKSGATYETVRWERVFKLLDEIGFAHKWAKDGFIPENVFYRLAMKAKNAFAEAFQAKIADEVIPSIRKHGAYMTPETLENMIASPEFGIRLLTELKKERDQRLALEAKVKRDAPSVRFARSVKVSNDTILVGGLAKFLRQNGVDIGQNRLFAELRERGYLIKRHGPEWNMPTQYAMDFGLFKVHEDTIPLKNGKPRLIRTTRVTGKGQEYFLNLFLQEKENKTALAVNQ